MSAHPTTDDLRSFLLGKLEATDCDRVAAHLEACPDCEVTIAAFDSEVDTLVSQLHGRTEDPTVAADPQLRRALEFVKRIGKEVSIVLQPEETPQLSRLREYQLLEKLGEGGMGAVYKALHVRLNKVVAIKVLPREKMKAAGAVARFEREMLAVGNLDHPHLIHAHDAGEVDGTHFLVMEYVAGCDLSQLVKERGPLPITDACEIVRQAALGLAEAHEHGLVHRDIKPSNLMLTEKGQVKVLDLGLALLGGEGSHELTTSGQLMGTIDYMAPEQGGDSHRVDARADIYSLGATLYKLLTGEAPFSGAKYDSLMRKLMALSSEIPAAAQQRRTEVPKTLSDGIARMLAKDPAARFASATEVVEFLTRFCSGANLSQLLKGTRPSITSSAVSTPSLPAPQQETEVFATKPQPPVKSLPKAPLLIAGGLLGLAGVILIAATVFFFSTPHGTLRVEINDPSIEVSVSGTDIVLKQPDQEAIKLSPGEKTLRVKRGDLEFTTDEFTLSKNKETVVKVELLPGEVRVVTKEGKAIGHGGLAAKPVVAEVPSPPKPFDPKPAVKLQPSPEKPVVLVRDGKPGREFRQLSGAMADMKVGDQIAIGSSSTFTLDLSGFDKPLHIRGTGGHRPQLILGDTLPQSISQPLTLEHCDLFQIHQGIGVNGSTLTLKNCRIRTGTLAFVGPKSNLVATDSILILYMAVALECSEENHARIQNCIVRTYTPTFKLSAARSRLELLENTFYCEVGGACPLLGSDQKTNVEVIAEDNIFHSRGQMELLGVPNWRETVNWKGKRNLYSGHLFSVFNEKKEFERAGTVEEWSKFWKTPEVDSKQAYQFEPLFVQTTLAPLQKLRGIVEPVVQAAREQANLPELGCNWDLVGAGDAYLKAIEADGRKPKELRPEVSAGGPIALLREETEVASYRSLLEAVQHAKDRDVIEIRSDDKLPPISMNFEDAFHITVRAGAGYTPALKGFHSSGKSIWSFEGLRFESNLRATDWQPEGFTGEGGIHRLVNCDFSHAMNLALKFLPVGKDPPKIINSRIIRLICAAPKGTTIELDNCVLFTLVAGDSEKEPGTGDVSLSHCVLWSPEPHFSWRDRLGGTLECIVTRSFSKTTARDCYFAAPESLIRHLDYTTAKPPVPWFGQRNAFALPFGNYVAGRADTWSFAEWKKHVQKEESSAEVPSPLLDARFWKLTDSSAGQGAGQGGADLGADTTKIGAPSPSN